MNYLYKSIYICLVLAIIVFTFQSNIKAVQGECTSLDDEDEGTQSFKMPVTKISNIWEQR